MRLCSRTGPLLKSKFRTLRASDERRFDGGCLGLRFRLDCLDLCIRISTLRVVVLIALSSAQINPVVQSPSRTSVPSIVWQVSATRITRCLRPSPAFDDFQHRKGTAALPHPVKGYRSRQMCSRLSISDLSQWRSSDCIPLLCSFPGSWCLRH